MSEQFANNFSTTLASSYTTAQGSITVAGATGAPSSGTFTVRIVDQTTGVLKLLFRVTSVAGTVFSGAAEGTDANANSGDIVLGTMLTAAAMVQIKADIVGVPGVSFTDPTGVSFSWRNQGSASIAVNNKAIYLRAPATASDSVKGREIAVPSTPWSITIGQIPVFTANNGSATGLYVTDGTKLVTIQTGFNNNANSQQLKVSKWSSVTTILADYVTTGLQYTLSPIFLKVKDDATNFTFYFSCDGINFIQVYQVAVGDYMAAATNVGFFADTSNSTYDAGVLLVSWAQGVS